MKAVQAVEKKLGVIIQSVYHDRKSGEFVFSP